MVGHYLQLLQIPLIHLHAIAEEPLDPERLLCLGVLDGDTWVSRPDDTSVCGSHAPCGYPFFMVATACHKGQDLTNLRTDCSWPPLESFTSGPERTLEVGVAGSGVGGLDPAGGLVAARAGAGPRRHDARCPAVGNRLMSAPVSAMMKRPAVL